MNTTTTDEESNQVFTYITIDNSEFKVSTTLNLDENPRPDNRIPLSFSIIFYIVSLSGQQCRLTTEV